MSAMLQTPTTEPAVITAGDTITWTRTLPDYPASGGWVLHYALRGPSVQDIVAAASGPDHSINTTAADWAAGNYSIQGYVVKGSERHTVYQGSLSVKPDLSAITGVYDGRSHAKRVLDAIEAVIEGRAGKGDQELTIDGTRLVKMSAEQLKLLRTYYRNEYNAEQRAENVRNGRGSGRKVVVRFTR